MAIMSRITIYRSELKIRNCEFTYTERDSKFGFLALRKPRGYAIASRLILLILTDLQSHNRGSFLFAKNKILKHVRYTSVYIALYAG